MASDPETDRATFTVAEFCQSHRISRAALYVMWRDGTGPRRMKVGVKNLISIEAAAEWRREREAAGIAQAERA
jgi:predicted DNA-binding transcriptional regulator AlpA